jgi:hypothetical protein
MASLQDVLKVVDWQNTLPSESLKVMSLIDRCHTASMGYHSYCCKDKACKHVHVQYHGCRNRHCPHCGSHKAKTWMENRLQELLPVKYFHVVFTLPSELKDLVYINRKALFTLLFDSSSHCLLASFKQKLNVTPSISSVLHTWGQQLDFHPHIHCIVSGGGVDKQNNWVDVKGNGKYLFPYKVMATLFRGYFMDKLAQLVKQKSLKLPRDFDWGQLKHKLYQKEWIVYAKNPMGNASQVIEYLGRYTQKIAISNHRIKCIDDQKNVHFYYKDYRDAGKRKLMVLKGEEFIRRFAQHILPAKFVRIRHYGILGNYKRRERINNILQKMNVPIHPNKIKVPWEIEQLSKIGCSEMICPKCKKSPMILLNVCSPQKSRDGPVKTDLAA